MKAFHDLGTCRFSGMGIGSIPWTSIMQYANWYGLEKDVTEAFVDIIREMDSAYVSYQSEEQKKSSEANKPKAQTR